MKTYLRLFVVIGTCGIANGETGYAGAEKLMEQVSAELATEVTVADPAAEILAGIQELIGKADGLTEEETAEAWIALFKSYQAVPPSKRGYTGSDTDLRLEKLFEALPPTAAWDELSGKIAALPDDKAGTLKESLQLVSATLSEDAASQLAAMNRLKESYLALNAADSYALMRMGRFFEELEKKLKARSGAAEDPIEVFRAEIGQAEKGGGDARGNYLKFPLIAGKIPDGEAGALILRALKLGSQFSIPHEPTARMTARVMMANPDALARPVWGVIKTPSEIPLFEMLAEKFPDAGDWDFTAAESEYVRILVQEGQFEKAHDYIARETEGGGKRIQIDTREIMKSDDGAFLEGARGFFESLLKEDPGHPYWRQYLALAEKTGKSEGALAMLGAVIEKSPEGTELMQELRSSYLEGLLGAERVDEALTYLHGMVSDAGKEGMVSSEKQAETHIGNSLRLARMARLLEKPDLTEEAFAAAVEGVRLLRKYKDSSYYQTNEVVEELVKQGRGPTAETLLAEELVFMTKAMGEDSDLRSPLMAALAFVYSEGGRHADVIALLEKGTMWDAGDLGDLARLDSGGKPLMLIAAESLHAVGRDDEAGRLLDRALAMNPGDDAGYALLLAIGGEGIMEKLERLHAENRFEERPLIWKAKHLLDSGKPDEAEAAAKAAIAIDPSDGEQGKGDRMRVYAVLAEIMERKGDKAQAEFLQGVVRAIRKSELADDWWNADMRKRAIAMYEESLKEFADAYCIQSRLALRYNEMGDFEKAEEHYRRAFELMPESFGRIESHCFGCEGAFTGELAQGIAERVFLKLAEETPDKAQVFYLLGYLRDQQGRKAEAADHFRKAVEIDPDYFNAWGKLSSLAEETGMSREERDRIILERYRLNPNGANLSDVSSPAKVWDMALEAEERFTPIDTSPVFVLRNSSAPKENAYGNYYRINEQQTPRKQITRQESVSDVIRLLEYLGQG